MLTRLEAVNYRCFERLAVDLGEYQVLVGANGSGKTTLLDLPGLIGELLQPNEVASPFLKTRDQLAPRAQDLRELLFADRGNSFSFAVEARLPESIQPLPGAAPSSTNQNATQEPLIAGPAQAQALPPTHVRYEMELTVNADGDLIVSAEYLFAFPESCPPDRNQQPLEAGKAWLFGAMPLQAEWVPLVSRSTKVANLHREVKPADKPHLAWAVGENGQRLLMLPRVIYEPEDEFPTARWLYQLLTTETLFLQPDWAQLRQASPPARHRNIAANGRNAPWLALSLKQENAPPQADPGYQSERFRYWVAHVRTALPNIADIDIRVRENDRHAYFVVTYRGNIQVPSSGLSDGTLRILTLTLLPYLSESPRILVTEEPENGIHPRAVEAVLQSLAAIHDCQVLVSSHSPVVLARTELANLLCARPNPAGGMEIIPGTEHPRLRDWQGGIDLGSLFAAGVMG